MKQIRKAPQIVQNVVTYVVVIAAANPDELLLPGMTANLQVVVAKREGVLKVPNTALRFRPTGQLPDEEARSGARSATRQGRSATEPGQFPAGCSCSVVMEQPKLIPLRRRPHRWPHDRGDRRRPQPKVSRSSPGPRPSNRAPIGSSVLAEVQAVVRAAHGR